MRNNQLISAVAGSVSPPDILIEKIFAYRNEKELSILPSLLMQVS